MVALSEDGGDPSIHVKSKKPSSTEEGPGNGVEGDPVAEQEDDPMDAVVVSSKDALSESIRDGESCPTVDASSDSTEDEDAVPKVAVESKKQFHSSEDGKQGGPVLPKEPLPSPRYIQATTHWPEGFRKRPDAINSGDEGDSDSSATVGDEFTPRRSARLAPKKQPAFNFVPSGKSASRKRKPDLRKDDFFPVSFESSYQTQAHQMVFRHALRMKSPSSPPLGRPR